jgi:hypothetical protein
MLDFLQEMPYDSDNYIVLDFETTNKSKGSALDESNRLVLSVWNTHVAGIGTKEQRRSQVVDPSDKEITIQQEYYGEPSMMLDLLLRHWNEQISLSVTTPSSSYNGWPVRAWTWVKSKCTIRLLVNMFSMVALVWLLASVWWPVVTT